MGAVGVGAIDAAIGATQLLAQHQPNNVLLIGTAGAHVGLEIGDVVVANSVMVADLSTLEGKAAFVFESSIAASDPGLVSALVEAGARSARVMNTLGVTTDDELAARLARHAEVEHLEAYAVARACQRAQVPCTIALGIANMVGSSGREAWRAHHVEVSARVAEVVADALVRSSRGEHSPG